MEGEPFSSGPEDWPCLVASTFTLLIHRTVRARFFFLYIFFSYYLEPSG